MNYLAHAFLSFEDEEILFGNFIGDFVKGRRNQNLPEGVWKGVQLHREIDSFTDNHLETSKAKDLIRNELGLASGIFIDMVFDHVLANKWNDYSENNLVDFTNTTYNKIDRFQEFYPDEFKEMFRYMRSGNWLLNYSNEYHMERFLNGVSRRLKVENRLSGSFNLYKENKSDIDQHFDVLFKDLINLTSNY